MFFFLLLTAVMGKSDTTTFSMHDHVLLANVTDPQDPTTPRETRVLNQMNALVDRGNLHLGVNLTNAFTRFEQAGPNHPIVLEKKILKYQIDNLRVELGDSLQQLGRGIALSLYQDDAFGIHNTLEGLSLVYEHSDFKWSAFGGKVNSLAAPVTVIPVDNPLAFRNVYLVGGAGELFSSIGRPEGHYFFSLSQPIAGTDSKRWHTLGGTYTTDISDRGELYAESNVVFSSRDSGTKTIQKPVAWGSYGALTFTPDQWKFKLETKDYRNYDFEFRRPPTLEEDIVVTLNNEDVFAIKLQADRLVSKDVYSASLLTGYDRIVKTQVYHAVIGGRWRAQKEYEAKIGYRLLPGDGDLKHISTKVKIQTFPQQSLELMAKKQLEDTRQRPFGSVEDRNHFEITYNFSERWNAGFGYENVPTNLEDQGNHFLNVNLAYKTGATTARVFLGQTSGGTRCSGGVCRRVPPFSGALVEGYFTF